MIPEKLKEVDELLGKKDFLKTFCNSATQL
jgi:hypothetical protein